MFVNAYKKLVKLFKDMSINIFYFQGYKEKTYTQHSYIHLRSSCIPAFLTGRQ